MCEPILLQSGPWHDKYIDDLGTSEIKMPIENRKTNESGVAVYIPEETRDVAHWSHNEWPDVITPA